MGKKNTRKERLSLNHTERVDTDDDDDDDDYTQTLNSMICEESIGRANGKNQEGETEKKRKRREQKARKAKSEKVRLKR